ncbi:mitochondrial carrier domain-containing protein [Lentinula raphanica]|uniref:Mitochondrial carrier domain-containing protein n=1 Tax=Lentinula raphanica TaxID=153919 RepID=A0AA38NZH9_9AGAR|nr:mitochondrial carrier domain-containing protein [Lentinula raphanica]
MLLSEAAEYPFDLAKVRLQSQLLSSTSSDGQSRFKGPMDCLMQTWRDEGFKGLYRGLPVPLYSAHPTTTPKPTLLPDSRPPGPFSIARHVVATNGLRGLWLGHIGTVLRETGGTAVWFAVKKWMARVLKDRAIAGAVCVAALYPADTVKSAMQTEEELREVRTYQKRASSAAREWSTSPSSVPSLSVSSPPSIFPATGSTTKPMSLSTSSASKPTSVLRATSSKAAAITSIESMSF